MDLLWAPWRLKYVQSTGKRGCFLCEAASSKEDLKNLLLYRGQYGFIILNKYPYNNGHLMVAPYRHISDFLELSKDEIYNLSELIKLSLRILNAAYRPHGFNIGMNLGSVAGAGLAAHLHIHIVPRWRGDTNFMPVISDTKVIPESLIDAYNKLKRKLEEVG
ncbi:HIT family hydrolase [Candidatus Bathyarchaeota archaeon ex4484_205]|nr:MAG: HIT family hydrolase [Candidatus Bathyarchaeota archaeon ex4484_205]RLG68510.1 MAG: HIT family hydrolase [archaeon]